MTLDRIRHGLRQQYRGAPVWLLVLSAIAVVVAGGLLGARTLAGAGAPSLPRHPVAVFLGDSYTQGVGASTPSKRWTTIVSKAEGWREDNLGRGGTGYTATADVNGCGLQFCPNYLQMVQQAIDADPDVVVVSGGQNDFSVWASENAAERAAIHEVYVRLRQALPGTRIYAIGPSTTGAVAGPVVQMNAAVAAAARMQHASFVSLIAPDVIARDMVLPDGGHVDDSGHAAIARRVVQAIRSASAQ